MDVSSTLTAAVTPPPFQVGTEEAKRDSQLREQIPSPKESHASEKNAELLDRRGATQGANSQLTQQQNAKLAVSQNQTSPLPSEQDASTDQAPSQNSSSHESTAKPRESEYAQREQLSKAYQEAKQERLSQQTALAKYASIRQISTPSAHVVAANGGSLFIASYTPSTELKTANNENFKSNDTKKANKKEDKPNVSTVIALRYAKILPAAARGGHIDMVA